VVRMGCCSFHFRMGGFARFRVRPLCFLFRSAFRVGDPVIPFLLAGSFFFSFRYNNRIPFSICTLLSTAVTFPDH
jgi:hypothetical protein